MLKTVKVPEPFQPLFEQAEQQVAQFFEQQKAYPEKGSIEIHDSRYVLVRGAAFSVEFFQLVRKIFGHDNEHEADVFTASLLYELAHAVGQSDAKNFHATMKLTDPVAKLSAGPVHFAYSGWASVEILPESLPSADENFCLIYKHPFSFECDAWLASNSTMDNPVCIMNAGYSSGWCQESFGIPLESREITCRSQGQADCLFVMAQPHVIEEKIAAYISANPNLDIKPSQFNFSAEKNSTFLPYDNSNLKIEVQQRLLSYARNLEATQKELSNKVEQLNTEIELNAKVKKDLEESEQRWRELSDATFDAILILQNDSIVSTNRASMEMFNKSVQEIETSTLSDLFSDENQLLIKQALLKGDKKLSNIQLLLENEEKFVDLQFHQATFNNKEASIIAVRDITEQAIAMQRLERLANYDALTGLPNRSRFQSIVNRNLMSANFSDKRAMLFLDLDNFKQVNDNYGHSAGDHLLFEIARRMSEAVRSDDIICRLGGDEFAIWINHLTDGQDASQVAQQIIDALKAPITINHDNIFPTFSIGIAIYPEDGAEYTDLTRNSDSAMYEAKKKGKNQYQYFSNITSKS